MDDRDDKVDRDGRIDAPAAHLLERALADRARLLRKLVIGQAVAERPGWRRR